MSIRIRRYSASDLEAIHRLNRKFEAAGIAHRVYSESAALTLDDGNERRPSIVERLFVAEDGEEIRGGVWLKEQEFWVDRTSVQVGWVKYPVCESLVDRKFAGVPGSMVLRLLREQPRLMALGMGGHGSPFARLLAAIGWLSSTVPLFFAVVRPYRVLRRLSYIRRSRLRALLLDLLALSGAGWLGHRLTRLGSVSRSKLASGYSAEVVYDFGSWSDRLWQRCRDAYGFLAVRDRHALNSLYPADFSGVSRVRVQQDGEDVGWICTQCLDMKRLDGSSHPGQLSLGVITDCFADPSHVRGVFTIGVRQLLDSEVDLIITYQSHGTWQEAARAAGLFRGPDNYAFYCSPAVARLLESESVKKNGCHLTRSDGDGPIRA